MQRALQRRGDQGSVQVAHRMPGQLIELCQNGRELIVLFARAHLANRDGHDGSTMALMALLLGGSSAP